MTVNELMEALAKLPPEAEARILVDRTEAEATHEWYGKPVLLAGAHGGKPWVLLAAAGGQPGGEKYR